ncbi:hypothetical protein, partial [Micromonospora sp. ATA51]
MISGRSHGRPGIGGGVAWAGDHVSSGTTTARSSGTWRLTLIVSSVGLLLLGVTAVLWAARTPAEAAAGDDGFMFPAMFGAVALFVAVSGRITTASALRHADLRLPQVPHQLGVAPRIGRQRRSLRRRSGIAYLYMAVTAGGLAGAALVNWGEQPRLGGLLELALAASGGAGCYLAGPAARFVVTPEYLRIETALRRISVPRHLLGEFSRRGVELPARRSCPEGATDVGRSPKISVGFWLVEGQEPKIGTRRAFDQG